MTTDCNIRISKSTHALLLAEAKRSRRAIKEIIAELVEKYLNSSKEDLLEQDREVINIDFTANRTNYKVIMQTILSLIQKFQNVDVKISIQDKSVLGFITYPLQHFAYRDGNFDYSYMKMNSLTLRDLVSKIVKCDKLVTIKVMILDTNILSSLDTIDDITDVIKEIETHLLSPKPPDFDVILDDVSKISSSVSSVVASKQNSRDAMKETV